MSLRTILSKRYVLLGRRWYRWIGRWRLLIRCQ